MIILANYYYLNSIAYNDGGMRCVGLRSVKLSTVSITDQSPQLSHIMRNTLFLDIFKHHLDIF
jgi:hypothetical protein